jgi:beta-galactosidase
VQRTSFNHGWQTRPHTNAFAEMAGGGKEWQSVTALTVDVYSDADEVELLLNGTSLGVAPTGEKYRFRATFEVPYAPGELSAVALTGGVETGRTALVSASGPPLLAAIADRDVIRTDDTDLVFLDISLQDAGGTVFAGVDRVITVAVEGPGVLQGLGSAAPAREEPYTDDVHSTFDGRLLAIVRPTGPGVITVTVSAAELDP